MRRPALAAAVLLLAACNPPGTDDVAATGEVPDSVVRTLAVGGPADYVPDLAPRITTTTTTTTMPPTTTTTLPPTTTTAAPVPTTAPPAPTSTLPPAPAPSGDCGGWGSLIGSLWPAEQVTRACRIMLCESNGNPTAQNPSGASGLFQVMPLWATDFAQVTGQPYYDGRFDPGANARFARWLWGQSGWQPWVCS